MKKKEVAIIFGITKDYAFALANVLIGMKKHHKKPIWDDIIVYHDGISENDKKILNSILKCDFILFDTSYVKKYNLDKRSIEAYSLLVFSKFLCFDLLKQYKKVIWHDVDILIQKNFSGLLDYANESGLALTLTDSNFFIESNFYKTVPGYSMYSLLYNSGVVVLSDKLSGYERYTEWCFEKTNELSGVLRYPDQGILNLLIQDFNIHVEKIDILKYCCHPDRAAYRDATIVHAYGSNKFWNSKKLSEQFPEWTKNHKEWVGLDGSSFPEGGDKVSIIMSVYDRVDFLVESVESMLGQTYKNIEIIIVVEYSKQQSNINKIINRIDSDKIIIINNKKKLGFAASLNVAINNCAGKYIARMDDDDISEPDRIERQVSYLNNHEDVGICGTFIQCFGNSSDKWHYVPTDSEDCKIQLLFCTSLYHPTVMMRRDVIRKNKLFYDPAYFTEDYELWSRVIKYTKIANIPEYLLRYRTSNSNVTINNSEKVHESHVSIMKKQFEEYLDLHLTNDELQIINKRIDVVEHSYNWHEAMKFRESVYEKIIDANSKNGFYNQDRLIHYLGKDKNDNLGVVRLLERVAKRLLRPVRDRFERFVLNRMRSLDHRVSNLETKIKSFENNN